MAQEIINIGTTPNDGTGDTLRNSFQKTNSNFTELYSDKENVANKATNLTSPDDIKYPTTLAVSTALSGKQDTLTNPITGTGANGRVAFFNGTNTQTSDSVFVWDNTNKRLSIGATIAGARLDVRAQGALSTDIAFRVRNSADNNDLIRVLGNGNVGIGTTSPYGKLGVIGAISTTTNDFIAGSTGSVMYLKTGATTGNTYGEIQVGINGDNGVFGNLSLQSLGGNVGIGTTTPTSRLHVVGLPSYSDNATAIAGGLTVGAFYHTGGILKVVI